MGILGTIQSDKSKNELFFIAVDYLFREHKIKNQQDLAEKIGISATAYSRIKSGQNNVSDETLIKFNNAFGGIFNMAFFRNQSGYLLAKDALMAGNKPESVVSAPIRTEPHQPASVDTDFYRQLLQARDSHIADLNRQLDNANALVLDYGAKITELNELIADLREQNGSLSSRVEHYKQIADVEKTRTDEVKTQLDDLRGALVGKQNVIDSLNKQISLMDVELKARRENPLLGHPFPTGVAEEPKNK